MTQLRAAIIGCGNVGSEYTTLLTLPGVQSHAHAYTEHPGTQLVAVCDIDPQKAQRCATQWEVPHWYSDHREMLQATEPDVVSICTPDDSHTSIGMDVLQTKSVRGIFCEKPLDTDLEKARQLVEASARQEVALAVNYIRRFDSAFMELKRQVQQGEFGTIQAVSGYYGKGLLHNGTHWLDLLRYLFGEVAWVEGSMTDFSFEDDTTYNAWFGMQSGFNAFLHGTDHTAFTLFEMDIVSSIQRAHLTQGGRLISYYARQASDVIPDDYGLGAEPFATATALETPVLDGVSNLVTHLEGKGELACTGNDGVSALEIAQAVQLSAQIGARVNLVH